VDTRWDEALSAPTRTLAGEQSQALTDAEAKAVAKLLSDPTYFPMEFRAWIKNYIESSDILLPASSITGLGGVSASGRTGLPAGIIVIYAGSSFGPDVLPCNGAAVSRTDQGKLFGAIGTSWGVGDNSSTFNVPDFRDRALYMAGAVIPLAQTDGAGLGARGGPLHHHVINLATSSVGLATDSVFLSTDSGGAHKHAANLGQFLQQSGSGLYQSGPPGTDLTQASQTASAGAHSHAVGNHNHNIGAHSHTASGNTSGGYMDSTPGWAGVNFCITTGKG